MPARPACWRPGCQSASYLDAFVVVDEDVDPDLFNVMSAICTRCDPANDIEFVRRAWSGEPLDPLLDKASSTIAPSSMPARRLSAWRIFPGLRGRAPSCAGKVQEKFAELSRRMGVRLAPHWPDDRR